MAGAAAVAEEVDVELEALALGGEGEDVVVELGEARSGAEHAEAGALHSFAAAAGR